MYPAAARIWKSHLREPFIDTSFNPLFPSETFFFFICRVLWQGVHLIETAPLETRDETGAGGRKSVHDSHNHAYRRLNFVTSLQNHFRLNFRFSPKLHVSLIKVEFVGVGGGGRWKRRLIQGPFAHVCTVWFLWRGLDVVSKGRGFSLLMFQIPEWVPPCSISRALHRLWTVFNTRPRFFCPRSNWYYLLKRSGRICSCC